MEPSRQKNNADIWFILHLGFAFGRFLHGRTELHAGVLLLHLRVNLLDERRPLCTLAGLGLGLGRSFLATLALATGLEHFYTLALYYF